MKPLLSYALLLTIFILNSGAGCGAKSEDPQPDNFQSLIGKWEAQTSTYTITKQDGSSLIDKTDLKAKGINITWEFFSDGRLVATQEGKSVESRWKLNVKSTGDKGGIYGTLTLIGTQQKKLAESIGQSGDLTYDLGTIKTSTTVDLVLDLDVTKIGPYKKNTLTQRFSQL